MIAVLAGVCLKGDATVCPPGSLEIPAIYALPGAFLLVALVGFAWLAYRSRR